MRKIAYCIGSYHSNAWKSDNPHSGVYESETAKTLDSTSCGMPCCNQGGVCVVEMKDDETENGSHPQDQGGCDIDSSGKRAGKGALIQWERSGTLGVSQDQTLFVWYGTDDMLQKDGSPKH